MMNEPIKRRRGRPRNRTAEANPVAKKRRGRPPKKKAAPKVRTKDPIVKRRATAIEENNVKRKQGRPTVYKEEYKDQVYNYCLLGATDKDLANFFDVDERTINRWKKDYPNFCQSLKDGRETADAHIGESLYQRAKGYSHPEDKIFNNDGVPLIVPTIKHYPPDPTSMIFWLKNRQPKKWRDKREVEAEVKVSDLSEEELDAKLKSIIVPMTENEE